MKQFNPETYHFMKLLKTNYHKMSPQQFKTLKGQCLSGDVEGAKKGFYKIIKNKEMN